MLSDLLLLYMIVVKSIKQYNVLVFCAVQVEGSSCCFIHMNIVKDSSMCKIVKMTGIANKTVMSSIMTLTMLHYFTVVDVD